jgi:hypothetical protein
MVGGNVSIHPAMQAGFIDEMEKLSSFMQNVGDVIKQTGGRVVGGFKGMGVNAGRTMRDMATSPIKSTAKGFSNTIRSATSGGPVSKAVGLGFLGLQGYQTYKDVQGLKSSEDPTGLKRGRGERLGQLVGSTAGGFIGAPHGITGGIVGSEVARRGLGYVGRGADKAIAKLKGRKAPNPADPSLTDPGALGRKFLPGDQVR